jgi:hypothetical protein
MVAEWSRVNDNPNYFVDITRLNDGRVMCCICFDYFTREELQEIEPGVVTDVCIPCWEEDHKAFLRRRV